VAPTRLSELAYAALCRAFERACTEYVAGLEGAVVVSHDISEGPDVAFLRARHVPVMLLVHVDVVDYFTRMYLRGAIRPRTGVRVFESLRPWPVVPDVLRLVYDKQWDFAHHASAVIVPSAAMRAVLLEEYPGIDGGRILEVGWGAPDEAADPAAVEGEKAALRAAWGVRAGERVVLTLSRVSPEKGQDRLLEAVRWMEACGRAGPGFRLVICGAPAFMQGESYMRRLRRLAAGLRTPVIFAGHLGGAAKRAALELADVFVSPSRHESYGLTTMEAFAAGTPAVATRTYGAEATVDPSCGRLVDGSALELPRRLWLQIDALLRDEALRVGLSEGARRRAETVRFSSAADRLFGLASDLRG
jgi:glycosyltransferase involved in cell wall biosynthesis